jgi:SOS response associated peptidase (SRAP)
MSATILNGDSAARIPMCGRYRLSRREQIIEEHFDSISGEEDWTPRYDIAPTQPVPVIRQNRFEANDGELFAFAGLWIAGKTRVATGQVLFDPNNETERGDLIRSRPYAGAVAQFEFMQSRVSVPACGMMGA